VERVAAFDQSMGHAGAVVYTPERGFEGASDPRSDGAAVGVDPGEFRAPKYPAARS
jgi:gamma-glutamyltranspeptidase/glutathione hydrolase